MAKQVVFTCDASGCGVTVSTEDGEPPNNWGSVTLCRKIPATLRSMHLCERCFKLCKNLLEERLPS